MPLFVIRMRAMEPRAGLQYLQCDHLLICNVCDEERC
jgi:hypothetical protein